MTDADFSNLRSLTARKLIRALKKDGFYAETRGSAHQQFYNANDGRRVTVTFHHAGDTFVPKTLRSMLQEQAKWTQADLKRLGRHDHMH